MEDPKGPFFTFNPIHNLHSLPMPQDLYTGDRCYSNTPSIYQASFEDSSAAFPLGIQDPNGQVLKVEDDACDSWLPDALSCNSPMSTNSSIGLSERAVTPSYPTQMPLPLAFLGPSLPHCSSVSMNHGIWTDDAHPESEAWVMSSQMPPWSSSNYDLLPLPTTGLWFPPVIGSTVTPTGVPSQAPFSTNQMVDSAPFKTESASSGDEDSSDDSDSDDGDSDHPPPRVEPRYYICPFATSPDIHGQLCDQRFNRPEHLRRHVKTKHGDEKEYVCKVPDCHTAFSRGDNLRDHYWTHLYRGGRRGKNKKMTLEELKAILGPKEKKLVKRLKEKLQRYKQKHWSNL